MNGYRRELKYIVDDRTMVDVGNRISGLLRVDEHQQGQAYKVRSIYFDSPDLTCYRENLAGVSTREKYRIRTYGCSGETVRAEIKIRHRETISKMSTPVSAELFNALIAEEPERAQRALAEILDTKRDDTAGRRVIEKYLMRIATQHFGPVCIVDYERSAYVYDLCNVRITFDRNIFASREFCRMFDDTLTGRPVLSDCRHVLEIKYDEFLPDEIKDVLGGMRLTRNSSSKYAMSVDVLS